MACSLILFLLFSFIVIKLHSVMEEWEKAKQNKGKKKVQCGLLRSQRAAENANGQKVIKSNVKEIFLLFVMPCKPWILILRNLKQIDIFCKGCGMRSYNMTVFRRTTWRFPSLNNLVPSSARFHVSCHPNAVNYTISYCIGF